MRAAVSRSLQIKKPARHAVSSTVWSQRLTSVRAPAATKRRPRVPSASIWAAFILLRSSTAMGSTAGSAGTRFTMRSAAISTVLSSVLLGMSVRM
jgi:hypothetical protein